MFLSFFKDLMCVRMSFRLHKERLFRKTATAHLSYSSAAVMFTSEDKNASILKPAAVYLPQSSPCLQRDYTVLKHLRISLPFIIAAFL